VLRSPRVFNSFSPTMALSWVMIATWLIWAPRSPDLAAQAYRVDLFVKNGFSLWDSNWYSGHYLPSYSLTFPPLAALVGLRWAGALTVAVSTLLFERLAKLRFGARATRASTLFAVSAVGDLYIGRLTFALGVTFALAAVLAAAHGRYRLTALLSLGCAAASPVAALFLALAATADLLANRVPRRFGVLALPGLALTLTLTILFPEGGQETFSFLSLLAASGLSLVVLFLLPARERLLSWGAALYLATLIVAYTVPSPMGSNAVRLGVLLAGPILLGAVGIEDVRTAFGGFRLGRPLRGFGHLPGSPVQASRLVLALTATGLLAWQINGPIAQSLEDVGDLSTTASYYSPVIQFLEHQSHDAPVRIEVPFTRSHWESVLLGERFALARGWQRQLDIKYNALFYAPKLTPSAYHAWLIDNAIRFVALPDVPLDFSSRQEAALIKGGLPYLSPVLSSTHWHIYSVVDAQPLASGPGRLLSAENGFTLQGSQAGTFTIRVRYTPYWRLATGNGCLTSTPQGWTQLTTPRAEIVTVEPDFSFTGLFDKDSNCT
jgi:hypothetical protein